MPDARESGPLRNANRRILEAHKRYHIAIKLFSSFENVVYSMPFFFLSAHELHGARQEHFAQHLHVLPIKIFRLSHTIRVPFHAASFFSQTQKGALLVWESPSPIYCLIFKPVKESLVTDSNGSYLRTADRRSSTRRNRQRHPKTVPLFSSCLERREKQ